MRFIRVLEGKMRKTYVFKNGRLNKIYFAYRVTFCLSGFFAVVNFPTEAYFYHICQYILVKHGENLKETIYFK